MSFAVPSSSRWPVLKPMGQDQDPRSIRLNRLTCVVGARSRVHLPLRSPLVSRAHALIILDEDEIYIRDLASRNGLQVNGSAVHESALKVGDLLRIGPHIFQCQSGFTAASEAGDAEEAKPRASLTVRGSERRYSIDGRTFLLGRRDTCDLTLDDRLVSRVHAVVFRRDNRAFVRDLNSKNGTFLNGRRVREVELADGDEMQLAGNFIRYHAPQGAPPREPAMAGHYDEGDESWRGSGELSALSDLLSVSGSVGSQTADARTAADKEPAAAAAEAPAATAEDFGFDANAGPPDKEDRDPELADVTELFMTDPGRQKAGVPPIEGGNGSPTNGDGKA